MNNYILELVEGEEISLIVQPIVDPIVIEIETNSIQVGTVTTGAAGSPATVVNVGTSANPILDFGIPRGLDGIPGSQGRRGADGLIGPQGPQGIQGPQGPAAATPVTSSLYEKVSDTVSYVGYSLPGTLTSAAGWWVRKIVKGPGTCMIYNSNGTSAMTAIWDDRLVLTYS